MKETMSKVEGVISDPLLEDVPIHDEDEDVSHLRAEISPKFSIRPRSPSIETIGKDQNETPILPTAQTEIPSTESPPKILPPTINPASKAPVPPLPSPPKTATTPSKTKEGNLRGSETPLDISITEYQKRGEGIHAFVVYRIFTKTGGLPGFHKKEYVVYRRFSDFLGLHDKMVIKHLAYGRIVPPPPEKNLFGNAKTKIVKGSVSDEESSAAEFLERRKASLERFLRRTSRHPTLTIDPDFRDFLMMESELPKASSTSAVSASNVRKLFTKVGDALSKMAFKIEENDRWFDEKANEVEDLDECLRKLHTCTEHLVHNRRELATSTETFCRALSSLAACEENTSLSRTFSQLAETHEKASLIQAEQAEKEYFIFSETLRDYIALLGTVKDVFYERVKVWNNWQAAQQNLCKKREQKTRLELGGKTDKVPAARLDVQEAERKVIEMEDEFERISKMIRSEMSRFETQRIHDFKQALLHYLESLAQTQQQVTKYWDAFVPEAKATIG